MNQLSGRVQSSAKSIRLRTSLTMPMLVFVIIISCLFTPCALAQVPVGENVVLVKIEGLEIISEEAVLESVQLKPGDLLTENAVRADLERISDMGFFFDVAARFYPGIDGVELVYEVVENPKIKSINFQGNDIVDTNKLELLMSVRPTEILNLRKLNGDLERILKYYYNEGYSAKIKDVGISEQGDVTIELVELRVADVKIEGHKKTKDYVIRRYISTKPGELLDVNELREDQRKLLNLGIFENIDVKLDPVDDNDSYIVTYVLKESRTGSAAIGAGYSNVEKFIGYIEVSESNFLGKLQTVNFNWQFGKGRSSYALGFYDPWIDSRQTSFGINLYNSTQELKTEGDEKVHYWAEDLSPNELKDLKYNLLTRGGNITVGRPIKENLRVSMTLRIDAAKYTALSPKDSFDLPKWGWKPGKDPSGDTRSLKLALTGDTRDHYMNPTKGIYWQASTETAGGLLGGSYTFSKFRGEFSTYREVRPNHILALRLSGGLSKGELPPHEQYRLGGSETLRGYDYGEFLGDNIMFANAEYRFRIYKSIQGAVFVDTGSTWLKDESLNVSSLSTGAGLGVRVETPIGMLRIDYGFGKEGGQAYLNFGQMF